MALDKTLCTLEGWEYLDILWPYPISSSTFYTYLHQILEALDDSSEKFPIAEEECRKAGQAFVEARNEKKTIKGDIGDVDDCSAIKCQPRTVIYPGKCHNRKLFSSVVV